MHFQRPTLPPHAHGFQVWARRLGVALWVAATLAGCGGGSGPADTPLPSAVALSVPDTVEVATTTPFATTAPAAAVGLQFSWDFGDGSRSTGARPDHAYATPGRYTVRVVVSDAAGRQVSAQATVEAVPFLRLQGLRCSGAPGAGWCRQLPLAWKPPMHDVQFVDARTVWAVGGGGLLMRSADAGATWSEQALPGAFRLSKVSFNSPQDGWVLGWASGGSGRAWRTRDGGTTWSATQAVPVAFAQRVQRLADGVALVWGSAPGSAPALTEDGGQTWRVLDLDVRHVEADGTLWGLPVTPPGAYYNERPAVPFRKSTDRGRSFVDETAWPAGGIVDWMGVSDGGWAWALSSRWVGDESFSRRVFRLWVRRGVGAPWTAAPLPDAGDVSQIVVSPTGSVVTMQGWTTLALTLWAADDPAQGWAPRSLPPIDWVGGVNPVDGRTVHAFGLRTEWPWISTDAGRSWVQATPGQAMPDDLIFMYGKVQRTPGGLLLPLDGLKCPAPGPCSSWYRSDDGRSWQPVWTALPTPYDQVFTAVWFRDTARGLAVTMSGSVLGTDNGGRSWRVQDAALPKGPAGNAVLTRLQTAPDGSLWALAGGGLVRSTDDGRTWVAAPAQPDLGGSAILGLTDFGWIDATRLFAVLTFCSASPHRPVFCSSSIYRSDDAARSWRTLPTAACERVRFLSPTQATCLSNAGNRFSTDGGLTWAPAAGAGGLESVVSIQRGAGAGGTSPLWALGVRQLLRSDDEGRSWQPVPLPALPSRLNAESLPEPVLLNDMAWSGARGWIVGNEGLIFSTDDGGRTWAVQASGVQSDLRAVFALDGNSLWVAAGTSVLGTATGGR